MKHMPAAVLEALEKKKSELMAALMENANKMDELKKVEDNRVWGIRCGIA